jgi:DNA-binding HxlR family transcriptional regulator
VNQLPQGNHTPARPPRDAVELAVDVLSDRWTFLILREAFFGVRRYGELQRNLGIARNVLAGRLRQMVADGLFERVRYRTDPDWYEYRLTERALDLYPVVVGLMRWADKHLMDGEATEDVVRLELVHRSCGHPAEPEMACAHCHEPLRASDIDARVLPGGARPASGEPTRTPRTARPHVPAPMTV